MAERIGWTRDQQLVALRLYMRTPFGKLHGRNPNIVALASRIGRTADALAMKACNFASLDPGFRQTNRTGLSGASAAASAADRVLWAEFAGNAEAVAAEAEEVDSRLGFDSTDAEDTVLRFPDGETEITRIVRARRVQSFFRAAVMTSYDSCCAISGLALPEILVASHIIPWATFVERRADPRNGLCWNALFDRAFDRGLITFDASLCVVVSSRLGEGMYSGQLTCSLHEIEGRPLRVPARFPPSPEALEHHRQKVFQR